MLNKFILEWVKSFAIFALLQTSGSENFCKGIFFALNDKNFY